MGVLLVAGADGSAHVAGGGSAPVQCAACQWDLEPTCMGNGPGPHRNEALCVAAIHTCEASGGGVRFWVYFRPDSTTPWTMRGVECVGGSSPPMTLDQITGRVDQFFRDAMGTPQPTADVQPADRALVRTPTLFTDTSATGPISKPFFATGFRITVTAIPQWHWDFGDGRTLTTDFGGHPYTAGVPVSDTGYYVAERYPHAGPAQLTLTVTWQGSYTLPGVGTVPIPTPLTFTDQAAFTVHQAHSELVSG